VRSQNCGCWIPRGAPDCLLHPKPVKTNPKARKRWGTMLDSEPEDEPVPPPRATACRPSPSPSPPPALRPLTPEPPADPPPAPPAASWGTLLARMKPAAPKRPARGARPHPAPSPKKPAPPARSGWLPRDEWLARKRAQPSEDNGFDIRVHGYWLTRSRGLVYRCPDGRELPATGVDAFET
jgi:hypothetical protein